MPTRRSVVVAVCGLVLCCAGMAAALAGSYSTYLPFVSRMPTPTAIPNVVVQLYLDANRTGERDTAYAIDWDGQWTEFVEPGIARVRVTLHDESGHTYECTSDDNGTCTFSGIPQGSYSLVVHNDTDAAYWYVDPDGKWREFPASSFMFRNERLGWRDIPAYDIDGVHVPAQHIPLIEEHHIQDPVPVDVSQPTSTIDVAIMMGLLASPLDHTTSQWIANWLDLDWAVGSARNYLDDTTPCSGRALDPSTPLQERTTGTCDNHQGTDFITFNGSPVYAMANGVVLNARDERWGTSGGPIWLIHDISESATEPCIASYYCHNNSILVTTGDIVTGGQLIAYSGDQGGVPRAPHLHANAWIIPREYCSTDYNVLGGYLEFVRHRIPYGQGMNPVSDDFWRDVLNPDSVSLWTMDNVRVSPLRGEPPAVTPTPPPPPPLAGHRVEVRTFLDCNGSGELDVACRPRGERLYEDDSRFLPENPAIIATVSTFTNMHGDMCGEEPALVGVSITLTKRPTGATHECVTDENGTCVFEGVRPGDYHLTVQGRPSEPRHAFRHISLGPGGMQPMDRPLLVEVSEDRTLNVGLMQGYLTLPWKPGTDFCVTSFFNFNMAGQVGTDTCLDWRGNTRCVDPRSQNACVESGVGPGRDGMMIGFGARGTQCPIDLYASAPGLVSPTPDYPGGDERFLHLADGRYQFSFPYSEPPAASWQPVSRGQLLGQLFCDPGGGTPRLDFLMAGPPGEGRLHNNHRWMPIYAPMWEDREYSPPLEGDGPILSWWTVWNCPFYAAEYFE